MPLVGIVQINLGPAASRDLPRVYRPATLKGSAEYRHRRAEREGSGGVAGVSVSIPPQLSELIAFSDVECMRVR